ncbi:DUF4190 domain-containing protein [Rhodococcoides fascians]|uniref:DUF4190 domain-containing protein n=1 Tax=Rhodococcoides fascians TaxID=1828 RepID=UPI0009B8F1D9|nr:DUF4190 domain-containing protein [Rhodococcus fascians]
MPNSSSSAPPPPFTPSGYPPQPSWGGQQQYGFQPQPRTNGLAIAALVGALFLAPLGIVFGHISLAQIKRSGEQGRGLALAGLIIGYVFTTVMVLSIVWLLMIANAFSTALDDLDSNTYSSDYYSSQSSESYPTYSTTTASSSDSSYTADVIADAAVGDCIARVMGADRGDGTSSVTVTEASCGSSSATHRVTSRGTSESACSGDWVSTDYPVVVLCLTEV